MLHKHETNYELIDGDNVFAAVKVQASNVLIQLDYEGIDATDVTVELEQSPNTKCKWDVVNDSQVTLDPNKLSHTYNIAGIASGVLLRIVLKTGTATTGILNSIIYLY